MRIDHASSALIASDSFSILALTQSQAMIYRIDQKIITFEIVTFVDHFFLSEMFSARFVNASVFSLNFSER